MKRKCIAVVMLIITLILSSLQGTIARSEVNQRNSQTPLVSIPSAPNRPKAEVRLNQIFYGPGNSMSVTVTVADASLINKDNQRVFVSSPDSKDVEDLPLKPTADPRVYLAAKPLIVEPALGAAEAKKLDGTLTLRPNEMFAALFVLTDSFAPNENSKGQVIADFGVMEDKNFATAQVSVDPRIALTDDEKQVPAGGKRIGTLALKSGQIVQVPLNEVIAAPRDGQELEQFLEETNGKILSDDSVPTQKSKPKSFLVQVDNMTADVIHLPQLRALFGEKETLIASSPEALRIYALAMQYNLEGFHVALNPRLQYMDAPSTRDGMRGGTPLDAMSEGAAQLSDSFADPIFGLRQAWAYLALWDKDTARIPVAFLDQGFAPNYDFRGYPYDIFQRDLAGDRSGPESAVGPPTVGNSLVGQRSWHGTGVVTVAGGLLNNGYGAAGTGGQVVQPMLYKMGLLTYAFEIGRGIRMAVDDGAAIINISAGYPCRILSILGSDDLCNTGGRAIFCAKVSAVVAAAAALTCAAAAAAMGWIPFVGAAVAAVLCAVAITAATVVVAACWGLVLAGDIFRGPMEEGVQYALDHGVLVVASAGNKMRPESVGALASIVDLNNHSVDDWQTIPAVLPGVICVGAADAALPYANRHFFGSRVDIWAPITSLYFHPSTLDSMGTPETQVIDDPFYDGAARITDGGFGGTSAAAPYISGIIAMMMAVNPNLNPHTPLAEEETGRIPGRIRDMLVSSATPASAAALAPSPTASRDEVMHRRNLVNALAAVKLASRDVIHDFGPAGYDTSLGFDETGPTSSSVVMATSDYGPVTGTILTIPASGSPGGVRFMDTDGFLWRTPAVPGVYDGGRVRLTLPLREIYGDVRINGQPGVLISGGVDEQVWEYSIPPLFEDSTFGMTVAGFGLSDSVYKLQFFAATYAPAGLPDRFEGPAMGNDDRAHAVPLGEGEFGWREVSARVVEEHAYELVVPDLNFNRRDDQDWFSVSVPDSWLPRTCDICSPTLTISAEPSSRATQIAVYNSADVFIREGSSPVVLSCEDYGFGRFPLKFVVPSPGRPVSYSLRLRWSIPLNRVCDLARRLAESRTDGSVGGGGSYSPFPRPEDLIGSQAIEYRATRARQGDPSPVDPAGRILKPELYRLDWRGGSAFRLEGLVTRGESLLLRLYDMNGQLHAQSATPDLVKELKLKAQPKQNVDTTSLLLEASQLPAGYYFLSVSNAKPKTSVYLTLPANAISDGSPALEDYLNPGSRHSRDVLLPLEPGSKGMAGPQPEPPNRARP
ncbi:MAG: S8 family serine peptidase [Acidobacteriota bacterium]